MEITACPRAVTLDGLVVAPGAGEILFAEEEEEEEEEGLLDEGSENDTTSRIRCCDSKYARLGTFTT